MNRGIADDWYTYRYNKYRGIAIEWCEENIEYLELYPDWLKRINGKYCFLTILYFL